MSKKLFHKTVRALAVLAVMAAAQASYAAVFVQCGKNNVGVDTQGRIKPNLPPGVECMHLSAGDGFITMADGRELYSFGFADVSNKPSADVMLDSMAANFSAPTIEIDEGKDFYLTLTNVSMAMRPDLFDPHTVHFHGFPQQPPLFDGMPEGSFGVDMGSSFTYFYRLNDPGTYMYHCHQEATEHMQMGMLGNLYVKPAQDGKSKTDPVTHKTYKRFAFNDGDGTTGYDVAVPLQLSSMDHIFHDLELGVQPLRLKFMKDTYPMINGRGYPDTVNPAALPPPTQKVDFVGDTATSSQPLNARVSAKVGERVLLRLSNLSVTNYYTVTALGLPMKVVGAGARHLRGPSVNGAAPIDLYYETTSVTLGGGESAEVLVDTTGVAPGTYFLYTTNLNYLSNFQEDSGGMMTEIVIAAN